MEKYEEELINYIDENDEGYKEIARKIHLGYFRDVDIALETHPNTVNTLKIDNMIYGIMI